MNTPCTPPSSGSKRALRTGERRERRDAETEQDGQHWPMRPTRQHTRRARCIIVVVVLMFIRVNDAPSSSSTGTSTRGGGEGMMPADRRASCAVP